MALEIDTVCPSLASLLRKQTSKQPIDVVSQARVAQREETFGHAAGHGTLFFPAGSMPVTGRGISDFCRDRMAGI